jgi:hypothetical protein
METKNIKWVALLFLLGGGYWWYSKNKKNTPNVEPQPNNGSSNLPPVTLPDPTTIEQPTNGSDVILDVPAIHHTNSGSTPAIVINTTGGNSNSGIFQPTIIPSTSNTNQQIITQGNLPINTNNTQTQGDIFYNDLPPTNIHQVRQSTILEP